MVKLLCSFLIFIVALLVSKSYSWITITPITTIRSRSWSGETGTCTITPASASTSVRTGNLFGRSNTNPRTGSFVANTLTNSIGATTTTGTTTSIRSTTASTSSAGMESSIESNTMAINTSTSTSTNNKKVARVGIFGGGTVGGGIVQLLQSKKDYLHQLTNGVEIQIVSICVNDVNKQRDFQLPPGTNLTTNYDDILNDSTIDIVIEVMGGVNEAKTIVYNALKSRKNVVTANKALISKHLPEIEQLLAEINADPTKDKVQFRYEAAVCGGIPIIRSLQNDYVSDTIQMLCGIINGCTNFMLTGMDQYGMSYDEALMEASKLGYAEADPTLDVGGFDARSKLRILLRLAYGIDVDEDQIACRGITELSKLDFAYAKMMGGTIKLVGVAKSISSGGDSTNKVAAFVSPCYVTSSEALASVNGATNAIEILSNNLQCSTYIGQGAGRFPTANSCMNDIISVVKGDVVDHPFNPKIDATVFVQDFESVFYIRLRYKDQIGITRQCGEICEKYNVSIHSILQNPITRNDDAAFVLVTEKVFLSSIKKVCADIEQLSWCKAPTFYMPVLREDWVNAMSPPSL